LLLALTYLPDPAPVLAESARVLKPGGKLVLVDLLPHGRDDFRRKLNQLHPGFPPDQLTKLLTTAGLRDPHIAPLPSPPEARGPTLFLATAAKP
jgi:ArsR family transcriptional regulator